MSKVVGLMFTNGVQALAKVVKEDDQFLHVENMLAMQLSEPKYGKDADGKVVEMEPPKLFFDDFTPFAKHNTVGQGAQERSSGIDTKIPWTSILFPFEPDERIVTGFTNRTSAILVR